MKTGTKNQSFTIRDVRATAIVAGFAVAFALGAVLPFIAHADQHSSDHGQAAGNHDSQDNHDSHDNHDGDSHDNGGHDGDSHGNDGHNDGDHNNDGHSDNGQGSDGHDGHDGDDNHGHDGCESDCDGNDGGTTPPPPPPPAPTGAIAIIKNTVGGDGTFSFSGTNSFAITTINGVGEHDFFGVAVGPFTLTEATQDGWTNGEISCVAGDQVTGMSVTANATTTCTVTNTKNTTPADGGDGVGGGGGEMPPPTPPAAPPAGGNGPIAGSLGNGGGGNGPVWGSVLGASSTTLPELPAGCNALLHTYMRLGRHNDSDEVTKLQEFLNKELGSNLTVNGNFDESTDAAVRQFQKAHEPQILTPWGINYATGYVYKTTQRWVNLTSCSSLNIPMPVLN